MAISFLLSTAIVLVAASITWAVYIAFNNLYLHPLANHPGPKLAAVTTLWRAFSDCILCRSFCHELERLHSQYGHVVRIGPNELHFANPEAYLDIYNNQNRWDKEPGLYHSFGEDRSSFGFLTYTESKERKDALNKFFSAKAVLEAQNLVTEKIQTLCSVFSALAKADKPADCNWAFRCMTMDIITSLCFGKSVNAIHEPDFKAPIIVAMDASLPVFARFKHSELYKNMIVNCPPNISKKISPETAGLVDLQQALGKQIADLSEHPENLAKLPHKMTIFHQLMDKDAYKNGTVPSAGSLYEEGQALMFAGADTVGNTLMLGTYYMLKQDDTYKALKKELLKAWPEMEKAPTLRELEQLPYLNAIIKESLRMSSGVVAGLLRIVPEPGARIAGHYVPAGTIVSCGSTFVHYNPTLFPSPHEFSPERWLRDPGLDKWLVSFSRGPRSCIGINLAWMELRLTFATLYRRFDLQLDPSSPKQLLFKDTFLPFFYGSHVKARVTDITA